ncbi:aspartate aminotransferase family protein [Acuticoccus sediminis]|uniref:Aspartate aminotransferase family protein n=1 Tax=Acuticoccus sediminis TaxID=2184697 RepID=A0A8B2NET2_9HYPH|nr:aminotransferase class III-fold pyridoxal phosphate-dependent enzyme [Acuticoccus sediminis]RAH97367.1 aspartate aminotransferase family protein [Acuticoccus sediminis]
MAEPAAALPNDTVESRFVAMTPGSGRLFEQARSLFPSGITHDSRHLAPYPLAVGRASGPRKWDVDGNEYVDYIGGHGALLLGHADPDVTAAMMAQIPNGTHYGSSHPAEVAWGALIRELMPAAERVRFTNSGTEATLLALRLARAYTGKPRFLRFAGHFHGWHDAASVGHLSHFDSTSPIGVLPGIAQNVVVAPPNDAARVEELLATDDGIAAVIVEPTGQTFGRVPIAPEFLRTLRELTTRYGVLLMFDEVITGFRVSPGGAQVAFGVDPDLTSLAKVVAGGMPGAAITGRKDILDFLDFEVTAARGGEKIRHQGTFNANPVAAAAGVAALTKIRDTGACERASATAAEIRDGLNAVFAAEGVPWAAYGTSSAFHLFLNGRNLPIDPLDFEPAAYSPDELRSNDPGVVNALRLAMMCEGVDLAGWPGGIVSATHGPAEVTATVAAARRSIAALRSDGLLA